MKMKYESDLCNISDCPPSDCIQRDIDAYRFVYNPICPKSFIPQGKKIHKELVNPLIRLNVVHYWDFQCLKVKEKQLKSISI